MIRCGGCIWISAGSAGWRKPKARRSSAQITTRMRRVLDRSGGDRRADLRRRRRFLYEKSNYRLPMALTSGDRVELLSAGAYVTTPASQSSTGWRRWAEYYL